MIIRQPHWCSNCRAMFDEWLIPDSGLKNRKFKPGDPWPRLEPIHTEAIDNCKYCNTKMLGKVIIKIDAHGEPEKIIGVKEIPNG